MSLPFKRIVVAFSILVIGIFIGWKRGIPFIETRGEWAIGIYTGESLTKLQPIADNHAITAKHITDRKAAFVADPFMIKPENKWYMFFEIFNAEKSKGVNGFATSSDGRSWSYESVVLEEPFHFSYPLVFSVDNELYMIPESHRRYAVMLYRANPFPRKWEAVGKLIEGSFVDSTVFRYDGFWWMLTADSGDSARLFISKTFDGKWWEHPQSPIIKGNSRISRPAGRIVAQSGLQFRVVQDTKEEYGKRVHVFRITNLDLKHYEEEAVTNHPFLEGTGRGWNAKRMHHLDAHELNDGSWLACVDGYSRKIVFDLHK